MALKPILKNEIATIGNDITFPSYGGVLRHNDDTLLSRGGGKGLKIYDEIERDCHILCVMQKRKMAVIARPWSVEAASPSKTDQYAADLVKAQLAGLASNVPDDEVIPQATGFDAACLNLLDAVLKGFSVGEIMWGTDGKEIIASEVRPKDQRRFAFSPGVRGYRLNLKTFANYLPGEPVPPRKFITHTFGAKDGSPYGLGLGHQLFWPALFKRQDITFWLSFADKFAAPTAVGKYPAGALPEDQTKLLNALSSIQSEAGIIIPDGMLIEFLEAARSGSIDTYEKLARYMDEQISECVLGETLSTNLSGGGSLAAAQTHNEVRLELVQADADILSGTLNSTLVKWITALNVPNATPPKVWRDCTPAEDLKARADRDKLIVDMGFKPSLLYIHETYGGEWTEKQVAKPEAGALLAPPAFAECPHCQGSFAEGDQQPDAAELIAAQAMEKADGSDMITRIREHIEQAGTLQKALDDSIFRKMALVAAMDKIGAAIGDALFQSNLTGRAAVMDDSAQFADAEYGSLPFDEAIAFFKQKLNVPSQSWTDLWKSDHDHGFTVAGAMRDDMLEDFRVAITQAITEGTTQAAFLKDFDTIVGKYGWSYNGSRGWRSRVIYETNIRTAYQAGRYQQMTDPDVLAYRPNWMYQHGDSVRPRPMHLGWNGVTLPADDPWWDSHFTPNGWGCKCRIVALSDRDLARKGVTVGKAPNDGTFEWVDKKSGEVHDVPRGIDPGWDYNPGKSWLNPASGKLETV